MVDLSTTYLGLPLKNPLVASASPLSKKVDTVRRMEEAGIAAVVMYSLFEEQIIHESLALDHYLNQGTYTYPEALTYFPEMEHYNVGPESYLELIGKIKKAVSDPGYRQLERHFHRWVGRLCPPHPGSRRRCPGAQHVLRRHRCQTRPRLSWRKRTSSWCGMYAARSISPWRLS